MTAPASTPVPCVVLGGSGYVAGELLRLLAGHPSLRIAAVVSQSRAGRSVESIFPHLAGAYPDRRFDSREGLPTILEGAPLAAVFCAGPHGESAALVDGVLSEAEQADARVHLVDLSADFRFDDAAAYASVYGRPHGAPERLSAFHSSLPEHGPRDPGLHVGHPGCFTTSVVLPAVPLVKLGLVEPSLAVTSVTGSTGSGSEPKPTTHHPERHANLYAYGPLAHRHEPEMRRLVARATGVEPEIAFAPHSGPFARGIHTTIHARLASPVPVEEVRDAIRDFYADAPFVTVTDEPPRLKDVVGTNHCRLAVATRGRSLVALSVIDNLVKGAAGGAVQWMNRLLGLEETAGLRTPGLGWS